LGEPGWYPGTPAELRKSIEQYLKNVTGVPSGVPTSLIVPHAGHRWSGQTAAFGYKAIEGQTLRRVFILGPNHTVALTGAALPSHTAFATSLGEVPIDTEVIDALSKEPGFQLNDRAHAREHDIEIQLPFLQVALKPGFRIVPILVGEIDLATAGKLAAKIRPFIGTGDLVLISSDFTHYGANYGYLPFTTDIPNQLKKLDMGAFEYLAKLSATGLAQYKRDTDISACGYYPMLVLLSLVPKGAEVKLLRYDRSGDQTGDFSNSVSYLTIAFYGPRWTSIAPSASPPSAAVRVKVVGGPQVLSAEEQQASLKIARAAVEQHVRFGKTVKPESLGITPSGKLLEQLGVFVTLEKGGELRGCIGNILPVARLFEGIIGRAIDAAANDYRFPPVKPAELGDLEVEISVLTKPHPIDDYRKIVLGKHGVVLTKQGRGAVFLPQVAPEQHWSLDETLTHLSMKAGLDRDAWQRDAKFEVFEAQVFRELREK
jgi:AmmeMemoRadiSam system protein B/AmmeMemoRadiSam system protein A